jgi:phospholipid/cholesterol/gamma-HCH transport system permease protein
MKIFYHFGRYLVMLKDLFVKPENLKLYWRETMRQMNDIGVGSLGIVAIISFFVGAVTAVQTAYQLISPLIPLSLIGAIVTDSSILELAPTITCLVLAGKVGSSIASELATMRVTEQIDALEVMGVNVKGYLILPKIIAAMFVIPLLIIIACFLSIYGGLWAGTASEVLTQEQYLDGATGTFKPYTVVVNIVKSITFAFIISSISSYHGFYTKGGALDVGISSTKAVVYSCIFILGADYIIAEILL